MTTHSVLPRNVASKAAFENAMALDVAMGGSTNTVLHVLAAAHEAELDFSLNDIDAISRRVGCICKVAPNSDFHMEDVHRAGGIPAILGELNRAGLLNRDVHTVHSPSMDQWLGDWDIRSGEHHRAGNRAVLRRAGRSPYRRAVLDGQSLEAARHRRGREAASAISNTPTPRTVAWRSCGETCAEDGCVIKAAGIDEELFTFSGPARVVESQEEAVETILEGVIQPGDVLRGSLRGPGRRSRYAGDAVSHRLPEGRRLGKECALHHRRSFLRRHLRPLHRPRLTRGLRPAAPSASSRTATSSRSTSTTAGSTLAVSDDVLAERRAKMDASERPWLPVRSRPSRHHGTPHLRRLRQLRVDRRSPRAQPSLRGVTRCVPVRLRTVATSSPMGIAADQVDGSAKPVPVITPSTAGEPLFCWSSASENLSSDAAASSRCGWFPA